MMNPYADRIYTNGTGKTAISGKVIFEYTESVTIKSKNGVDLCVIRETATQTTIAYEIRMDGELINRFKSQKTATSMWKDFAA